MLALESPAHRALAPNPAVGVSLATVAIGRSVAGGSRLLRNLSDNGSRMETKCQNETENSSTCPRTSHTPGRGTTVAMFARFVLAVAAPFLICPPQEQIWRVPACYISG